MAVWFTHAGTAVGGNQASAEHRGAGMPWKCLQRPPSNESHAIANQKLLGCLFLCSRILFMFLDVCTACREAGVDQSTLKQLVVPGEMIAFPSTKTAVPVTVCMYSSQSVLNKEGCSLLCFFLNFMGIPRVFFF